MKARNALLPALAVAAMVASATAAKAGEVSATASVSVTIVAPVTLQATQGLDFGAVTRPGNSGASTITLDPAGGSVTLTGTGDGARAAGSVSPARFALIGEAGVTYSTTQSLS